VRKPDLPRGLRQAAAQVATVHLRNMGTIGGNLCLDTRCTYYNQNYEWRKAIDFCLKKDGDICWVATASKRCVAMSSTDCAPALLALGARVRLVAASGERELALEELYRLPDESDRSTTTLEEGELLLEVELPPVQASVYLKAMDRKRWSFPQVGVAVARHPDGSTRIVLAGVAPIPWRIESVDELDSATPLPRTEWKVPLARALVRRALAQLG
jgi:CO/xanthine dehydrogenase FAD-binding subunit